MNLGTCMSSLCVVGAAVLVIVGRSCLDSLWHHAPVSWSAMLTLLTVSDLCDSSTILWSSACLASSCACFCCSSSCSSPFDMTFARATSQSNVLCKARFKQSVKSPGLHVAGLIEKGCNRKACRPFILTLVCNLLPVYFTGGHKPCCNTSCALTHTISSRVMIDLLMISRLVA